MNAVLMLMVDDADCVILFVMVLPDAAESVPPAKSIPPEVVKVPEFDKLSVLPADTERALAMVRVCPLAISSVRLFPLHVNEVIVGDPLISKPFPELLSALT